MSESSFDILFFTETWLNPSIADGELFDCRYQVFRSDRDITQASLGGGTLLAISKKFRAINMDTTILRDVSSFIQTSIAKCYLGDLCLLVGVVYVPPAVSHDELDKYFDALATLINTHNILLMGDFNVFEFADSGNCPRALSVRNFVDFLNLKQMNTIRNSNGRILDLIFTNLNCQVVIERELCPFVPEDTHHPALSSDMPIIIKRSASVFPNADVPHFNFRRADFPTLYNDIALMDWSFLESLRDVNKMVDLFYSTLYDLIRKSVPCTQQRRNDWPQWFSKEIIKNIKSKEYYRRKYKSCKVRYYLDHFVRLRTLVKEQIDAAYKVFLQRASDDLKRDPGEFWNFVRLKQGSSRLPLSLRDDVNEYTEPVDIVNAFDSFFASVYSDNSMDFFDTVPTLPSFNIEQVNEDELIAVMKTFGAKLTRGEDQIPSFLIRDARYALAKPLMLIINCSLTTSIFPQRWKLARITPIFKKGDKSLVTNYRPIAILSNFAKVYEQIMYNTIYNHTRSFISPYQHGFIPKRSTVSNLCCLTQYIAESMDMGGQVDVIYTDFEKAFDRIDHNVLLNKMSYFGMSSDSLSLMKSYLSDRVCCVFYNGFQSRGYSPISGIPQGSNLGPLLFVLYINDLLDSITCPVLAYADDLKIYMEIRSLDDAQVLQTNLDVIHEWCCCNALALSINKCSCVSFTKKLNKINTEYIVDSTAIIKVGAARDLGVVFDSELSFLPHIEDMCSRAWGTLGFILRILGRFGDLGTLKTVFMALVISRLQYASIIWYPIYTSHQLLIEKVQRRFLKFLSYRLDGQYPARGVNYVDLLHRHEFSSLQTRRMNQSASYLQKLLCGEIDCAWLLSRVSLVVPRTNSRSHLCLYPPLCRTNVLKKAPISHMVFNINDAFE